MPRTTVIEIDYTAAGGIVLAIPISLGSGGSVGRLPGNWGDNPSDVIARELGRPLNLIERQTLSTKGYVRAERPI